MHFSAENGENWMFIFPKIRGYLTPPNYLASFFLRSTPTYPLPLTPLRKLLPPLPFLLFAKWRGAMGFVKSPGNFSTFSKGYPLFLKNRFFKKIFPEIFTFFYIPFPLDNSHIKCRLHTNTYILQHRLFSNHFLRILFYKFFRNNYDWLYILITFPI